MHVCIVRHSYYPQVPPTQRNAETLVSHGYQVDVICLRQKGQKSQENINGVNVHRLPLEHVRGGRRRYLYEYAFFFILAAWKLYRLAMKCKFKVVEVNSMPEFLVFITLPLKLGGTRIILNMLDRVSQVLSYTYNLSDNNLIVKFFKMIEKASTGYADHVFLCNNVMIEEYIKQGGNSSKASVVMNVPNEDIFYRRPTPRRSRQDKLFRVMTHGSLLKRYGVHTLIQAVPLLLPNIPEIDVTIVGDGEYRLQLEELSKQLGLDKHVHFIGFVPIEKVPEYINKTEIGIVPILMHMQPTKLFEYVSMGKPVVTSDFPSIRSCFDENSVIYYTPGDVQGLADGTLKLYRDAKKRENMAKTALSIYQKCRWEVMQQNYLNAFDKMAKDKKTADDNKR